MSEFLTGKGVNLTLKELSPALIERVLAQVEDRLRAEGLPIDPPTYTLKNVVGETQEFPMTEKTLDTQNLDEAAFRHAKWDAYQTAQTKLEKAQNEARVKFMLTWGIDFEMPTDESWKRLLKAAGVEIPSDPDELRFTYLWYHLLTPVEVSQIIAELQLVAYGKAVKEEDVNSFRQSLQDSVSQRARAALTDAVRAVREAGGEQG